VLTLTILEKHSIFSTTETKNLEASA